MQNLTEEFSGTQYHGAVTDRQWRFSLLGKELELTSEQALSC